MIDLDQLEAQREVARRDKADLFDFYNDNWDALIEEIRSRDEADRDRNLDAKFEDRR